MGMFLNSSVPFEGYKEVLRDTYFVDKTAFLSELIPYFGKRNLYCCITRPRRFGKTVMANMVGAFFGKTDKKDGLFGHLAISKKKLYETHLNQHEVIYIDFSKMSKDCKNYESYIARIQDGIVEDLLSADFGLDIRRADSIWDTLQKIHEQSERKFLFVLDEWDAVFHMPVFSMENQKEYLLFLKNLLKDQPYVEFAYMTGVLPIAKYSSGSELNMFVEYDMVTSEKFSEYFGFSDDEVDVLYEIYQKEVGRPKFGREELRK